MPEALVLDKLVTTFGATRALDGLDLTVGAGEVHGFLGRNGAGKTTAIRILLGLLRADSGTARLLGGDPWGDVVAPHRRLAYVPGDVSLWPSLSGGEVIDLLGRLRGGLEDERRADLFERFELDPAKKGRAYSKGNRQKVALIAALAADVELYLPDEPTSGLDPLMVAEFRVCVRLALRRDRVLMPVWVALIVALMTNGALGLLTAAGLAAVGLPAAGSLAFGLSWASVGVVFASPPAVARRRRRGRDGRPRL